jgi:hypothetical protein
MLRQFGDHLVNNQHIPLDLIQVASPCPASWDAMQGDERVRHCDQCRLNVYNLSEMTRTEAERLLAEREGRTCVRFFRRHDGTVLTRDCPVGLRAMRQRLMRGVAAVVGLVIATIGGTVFGGAIQRWSGWRPTSHVFSEWIEPTPPPVVGVMVMGGACAPPANLTVTVSAPESPLPDPTPDQMEEISERLR